MEVRSIDIAEQESWPVAVRNLLDSNLAMLQAYEEERRRLDAEMRNDVLTRINPPTNPHAKKREELISYIDKAISEEMILAWHCTRLLPHEQAVILTDGLQIHSFDLFNKRIERAVEKSFLTSAYAQNLITNGHVGEHGRDGLLHLILNRKILTSKNCVIDLLRNWGGEAIYNNAGRSDDNEALHIGEAAIIEVAIPVGWLKLYSSLGEQMLSRYLSSVGVATEHSWGTDAKLCRDMPAAMVRRVILSDDPTFEELTGASGWDCSI